MLIIGSSPQIVRVLTCSHDRAIVLYDLHSGTQIFRLGLPEPIEAIACNAMEDKILAGSSSGCIYCVDMVAAYRGLTTSSHSTVAAGQTANSRNLPEGVTVLTGHTKAVSRISCSATSDVFVSASADGSLRWWDCENMHCVREVKPFQKTALTNAVVRIPAILVYVLLLLLFRFVCDRNR
jgi:WD40 repeat protein